MFRRVGYKGGIAMLQNRRQGFTLLQLLVVLAIFAILLGLLLPAIQKVREAASRMQSTNNLKQVALGCLNYESTNGTLPPGKDVNNYSAFVYVMPYLEANNLLQGIDKKKPLDETSENIRARRIKMFESPRDNGAPPSAFGPTNYLFVAGAKPDLKDNDGLFYTESKTKLVDVTDGISNTLLAIETLRGDGGKQALDVRRQNVRLDADALAKIKEDAGVDDFANNRNIAGNRGGSWMDGRFLQSTFTGTRTLNDARPDVDCGGQGGLSGVRTDWLDSVVAFGDGSVRTIKSTTELSVWKALCTRNGGEVIQP
jgi:prepilin-type N-terminal cleavage/methylation domain-containing protein